MNIQKRHIWNNGLLDVSFLLIFTSFGACSNVQTAVLNNFKENHSDFSGNGYISLSIVYFFMAFSNWFAPNIISFLGIRFSFFFSSLTYAAYLASFIYPMTATIYIASAFLGLGAAVIWTAQGFFITINSTSHSMPRYVGIFWVFFSLSMLFGNLFVHFSFHTTQISDNERYVTYTVFTVASCVGTIPFLFIVNEKSSVSEVPSSDEDIIAEDLVEREVEFLTRMNHESALEVFLQAIRLLFTPRMLLLVTVSIYTGLETTLYSGVYGTCIANTLWFPDSNNLVGISGLIVGLGEITGGLIFGIMGKFTVRIGRSTIVLLGSAVHLVAFFFIFINIPNSAPISKGTYDFAYIHPQTWLALLCSYLLGFADSCFMTQLLSILSSTYSENSVPAFAVYKSFQSMASAVAFFYTKYLVLYGQLLILVIVNVLSTLCYFAVDAMGKPHVYLVQPTNQ